MRAKGPEPKKATNHPYQNPIPDSVTTLKHLLEAQKHRIPYDTDKVNQKKKKKKTPLGTANASSWRRGPVLDHGPPDQLFEEAKEC